MKTLRVVVMKVINLSSTTIKFKLTRTASYNYCND